MQAWQWLISPRHKKKKPHASGLFSPIFFLRGHVVYLFFFKKKHKMENTLLTEINDTLFVYLNFSYHYSNLKLRKVFFFP